MVHFSDMYDMVTGIESIHLFMRNWHIWLFWFPSNIAVTFLGHICCICKIPFFSLYVIVDRIYTGNSEREGNDNGQMTRARTEHRSHVLCVLPVNHSLTLFFCCCCFVLFFTNFASFHKYLHISYLFFWGGLY